MKNRLAEFRKKDKISQEQLGEQLSVSRQTILSIEKGRYNPSLDLAFKLANYFEVTIEDIFIFEEERL